VPSITGAANICVGSSTTLNNTTTGGSWSSSNAAVVSVNTSGTISGITVGTAIISYTVTNTCGSTTQTFTVNVSDKPTVTNITGPNAVNTASSIQLANTTPGGVWSTNSIGIAAVNNNGLVTGMSSGTAMITYTVTNSCGSVSKTYPVTVSPFTNDIFVPNYFTPNGDGKNDYLAVFGTNIKSLEFHVFNQWGQQVFETRDITGRWDGTYSGKVMPVGVYVFIAKVTLLNGLVIEKKGAVNLIR